MTEPDDPARLLDTPSAPAGLRDALRAAQSDVGSDAQVARLAERLGPLLGPALPAAAGVSGALKLGLAGVALVVAGGGAWMLSAPRSATPPPAPAPVSDVAQRAPVEPLGAPQPSPSLVVTPEADVAPEAAAAVAPVAKSAPVAVTKQPDKPTPPAAPSEAELLEQARATLKSNPARALQRANEHATRYPGGVLVQEREVLAIQALRGLGRSAEAERRAAAFAKAFPGSPFARKLNASP